MFRCRWLLLHMLRRFTVRLLHHLRMRQRLFAFNLLRRQRMPFRSGHFTLRLLLRAPTYSLSLRLLILLLSLQLLRCALLIELLFPLFLLELLHLPARFTVALGGLGGEFRLLLFYAPRLLTLILEVQLFMLHFFRHGFDAHKPREVLPERRRHWNDAADHSRLEKFLRNTRRQVDLAAPPG